MACYLIAQLDVNDWGTFKTYQGGVLKSLSNTSGRVLAAGPASRLEGDEPRALNVIFEFPDRDSAQSWYDSDTYQALIPTRNESAPGANFILVEGL